MSKFFLKRFRKTFISRMLQPPSSILDGIVFIPLTTSNSSSQPTTYAYNLRLCGQSSTTSHFSCKSVKKAWNISPINSYEQKSLTLAIWFSRRWSRNAMTMKQKMWRCINRVWSRDEKKQWRRRWMVEPKPRGRIRMPGGINKNIK